MNKKLCVKCNIVKPISSFGKNIPRLDGLQVYCKSCVNEYHKEYYWKNRDRLLAEDREKTRLNTIKRDNKKLKQCKVKQLSETEKAYIAGFIDADGTIIISNSKKIFTPRIVMGNCNKLVLETIQSMIGVGKIYTKKMNTKEWRTLYHYSIGTHVNLIKLIPQLIPYLILKRKRAELVLEFCNIRHCDSKSTYKQRCFEIYDELKTLNRRGNKLDL